MEGAVGRDSPSNDTHKTPRKGGKKQHYKKPKTPGSAEGSKKTPQNDVFTKRQDPPYEEYWSKDIVSTGIKRGELIKGVLRINQKDYTEAYVDDSDNGPDYYIPGVWARNRALHDDEVVIQVMTPDKWEPYRDTEGEKEERLFDKILSSLKDIEMKDDTETKPDHTHNPGLDMISVPEAMPSINSVETTPPDIKPTLIDALYHTERNLISGSINDKINYICDGKDLRNFRRTAKVIFIINKGHSRACVGTVKIFNKVKGLALFSPKDGRMPRIIVPLSDLPDDFPQNHSKYETTLFICRIIEWNIEMPFPSGNIMRSLGEAGEIEPETNSILTEYEIDDEDFPSNVLECLPSLGPDGHWKIPEDEIRRRRDFRNECVLSIDPSTARDLDDALHCKEISPGVYEVGVHIADVSYFLESGTPLDTMASNRATSVYLIQRVIPMLPRRLCEDLCSLNPNEDKLTFSVVWTLTLKGELLNEWMGHSIICSRAKLSYDEAQLMIDNSDRQWQPSDFQCIINSKHVPIVVNSVIKLNKIAKQMRFLRQSRGTLRLDQPKLSFSLNKDTGLPNGCNIYKYKESNRLIEEFMLLANMAVAHKISKTFPEIALLRRHPTPKSRSIDVLRDQCRSCGIILNLTTAGDLQKSLNEFEIKRTGEASTIAMEKHVVTIMCCRIMELARYFCTGCIEEEKYLHYALNVPRYTHFTSPIRRYPDVIVHRLLSAALNEGPNITLSTEDVDELSSHCNKKRKNAKTAEELSSNLFLGVFVRECGPLVYPGMVVGVLNKSFDVYISELAVIKRVYCEKLPLNEYKYDVIGDHKESHLLLVWKEELVKDKNQQVQDMKVFLLVEVVLTSRNKTLQFDASIDPPH